MTDAPPSEEFGPYLVYERLGQGGMATVHRAEKRGVGFRRPVALKRLLPHIADDPDLVQLFLDEARLASQLHHANVAQTYELGKVGETFFIAMEYADGPTLSQVIRQAQLAAGDIPLTVTVNILTQVCDALDYAHNLCDASGQPLRIIHRDVSPGNIIVTSSGLVKLIDFGIAKATSSSVHTQAGFIKGKFGYIAPEYLTGKIDARVDLFAIGVVAHEMMTGRRLFEGNDDFQTLANLREMRVEPPSRWNRHVPPDLDDIVMTALQRDPAKRWQSAAALQVALTAAAREFGVVVGSPQLAEWIEWAFRQVPDAGASLSIEISADSSVMSAPAVDAAPDRGDERARARRFETAQPTRSEIVRPTRPEPARPSLSELARPSLSEFARPTVPELARPSVLELARPTVPDLARPSALEVARPTLPELARPTLPEMARPTLLELARRSRRRADSPSDAAETMPLERVELTPEPTPARATLAAMSPPVPRPRARGTARAPSDGPARAAANTGAGLGAAPSAAPSGLAPAGLHAAPPTPTPAPIPARTSAAIPAVMPAPRPLMRDEASEPPELPELDDLAPAALAAPRASGVQASVAPRVYTAVAPRRSQVHGSVRPSSPLRQAGPPPIPLPRSSRSLDAVTPPSGLAESRKRTGRQAAASARATAATVGRRRVWRWLLLIAIVVGAAGAVAAYVLLRP